MKRDGLTSSGQPDAVGFDGVVGDTALGGGVGNSWRFSGFLIFAALLTVAFASSLLALFHHALGRDLHSHIVLIPFVSGYLIFLKRSSLGRNPAGSPVGGGIAFGAGVVLVGLLPAIGGLGLSPNDSLAVKTTAYLLFLLGGALGFLGWKWLRVITFPVFLLVFMIPLPDAAVGGLESLLVIASAEVSYWFFLLSGTPVFRDGQSLQIPGIVLEVARECSGIRSTLVLVITSLIASYLFLDSPVRRGLLIAAVLPLGVLRNAFRILVIGLLCVHYGPEMIHSWIHKNGGPIFFALSLIPLFALGWLLRRRESRCS